MTTLTAAFPRTWPVLGLAVTAGIAGTAAFALDWRLAVPLGLGLPLATVIVVDPLLMRPGLAAWTPTPSTPTAITRARTGLHSHRSIATVWALLFLGSEFKFLAGDRPTHLASSGSLSGDNLVELLTYVPAALVVGSALRHGWPGRMPRIALGYGLYAAFALLSVTWSELTLLSAGMALQLCGLAAFTAYSATRAAAEPDFAERLLLPLFRYIVLAIVLMAASGVLEGLLAAPRFTWRGQHPNGAAGLMVVATLMVVLHPRRALLTRPLPWWSVVLGLLPLTYATGSRATVGAGLIALSVALAVAATRNSRIGAFGVGVGLVAIGSAMGYASDKVVQFLYRGQSTSEVVDLNGRMELWTYALQHPEGSEVWGVGVGAARSDWPLSWDPQHVHSAWIDSLITLGVIGAAVLGAVVVALLALVVLRRHVQVAWMATLAAVASLTSVAISQPGYTLIVLALAMALIPAARPPGEPDTARTATASSSGPGDV